LVQQRAVNNLVHQRVLEAVFELGKQIALIDKFGCLQIEQIVAQFLFRQTRHRAQQPHHHDHADHRSGLQQLLFRGRQAIDALGERKESMGVPSVYAPRAPTRAPVSTSERTISSMKNGLPRVRLISSSRSEASSAPSPTSELNSASAPLGGKGSRRSGV